MKIAKEIRDQDRISCQEIAQNIERALIKHNVYLFSTSDCLVQFYCTSELDYDCGFVSRALQMLKNKGVVRYRRDYRQWEFRNFVTQPRLDDEGERGHND